MQSNPIQNDAPLVKKPYVKPLVEHVELKIEEAVLASGCKNETNKNARGTPDFAMMALTIRCDPGWKLNST